MNSLSFSYYPKKWGMQLHYTGRPRSLREEDLANLENLRVLFADRRPDPLSWKFDLKPVRGQFTDLLQSLHRLWACGYVVKFAQQDHTVHGNPEYISWLIWEERDEQADPERLDTPTIGYIV